MYRVTDAGRRDFHRWMSSGLSGSDAEIEMLSRLYFLGLVEPSRHQLVLGQILKRLEGRSSRRPPRMVGRVISVPRGCVLTGAGHGCSGVSSRWVTVRVPMGLPVVTITEERLAIRVHSAGAAGKVPMMVADWMMVSVSCVATRTP